MISIFTAKLDENQSKDLKAPSCKSKPYMMQVYYKIEKKQSVKSMKIVLF